MSIRRLPLFALSLFLALLLVPSPAFAAVGNSSVLWSGSVNDGAQFGAFVKGGSRYDAAVSALGYDSSRLSDEVKSRLSDSSNGGMFYVFANSFSGVGSPVEIPSWVPSFVTTSALVSVVWDAVAGEEYPYWYVAVSQSVYDLALSDFFAVLNGEDLGGGGSDSPTGSFPEGDYYHISVVHNGNASMPTSFNFYHVDDIFLSVDAYNRLSSLSPAGYKFWVLFFKFSTGSSPNNFNNWTYGRVMSPNIYINSSGHLAWDGLYNVINLSSLDVLDDDGKLHQLIYWGDSANISTSWPIEPRFAGPAGFYLSIDSSTPVVHLPYGPDGDWPEPEPTPTPTAPVLPDPVSPTVEPEPVVTEPTPTWPDVNITVNPPAVIVPDTPEGLDYTQLLTLINDNLESIDAYTVAINSSLNSLRSDLVTEFDGVVQSLRNIYSYLQHMDSVLERHCVHLQNKMEDVSVDIQNKMRELVHWLAEQLDFDSVSSGNSDLFGILSTINDKLGGGTYEPNPIRDEMGYYEWLDNLWDRFLLGDNWQSSASSMSQSFGQLTSRFPFSVPWDIVALFRLFVHDPVTPVFDLPLYYSADDYATVHVDLSGWDGVASVVRPLVFVIFALNLALLSRHLLGVFGADKGGL